MSTIKTGATIATTAVMAFAGTFSVTPAEAATYNMTGKADPVCTAGTGSTLTLDFGTLVDTGTGATKVSTPNPSVTDGSAFCNQAKTDIKVQHTDLTQTGVTAPTNFTFQLPISSVTVTSPQNTTGVTDNTAPTGTNGTGLSPGKSSGAPVFGAFKTLIIQAQVGSTGTNSLVAGTYNTGSVVVTLSPAS